MNPHVLTGFCRGGCATICPFGELPNGRNGDGRASACDRTCITEQELADLERISRSRTEPASRVERARILLTYRATPSLYATGRSIGVTHQTVERCLRRAQDLGVMAALHDSPRPGREPIITSEARTFIVDLACRKAKDLATRMNFGRRDS
jgi:hypothetical protein